MRPITFATCDPWRPDAVCSSAISPVRSRFSPRPQLPATVAFDAPKYGLATRIPKDWPIAVHEEDDRIFVAIIPQQDFERPESRPASWRWRRRPSTIIEPGSTRVPRRTAARAASSPRTRSSRMRSGERLETIWEFHPDAGGFWREVSVRIIANRQLYTFILNVEDGIYAKSRPAFDAVVSAASFSAPNTGADLLEKKSNRWIQREYRFALDLPEGWRPALAPSEVALLFANGPPMGIWSDNLLVLAHPHQKTDLEELAKLLPGSAQARGPELPDHRRARSSLRGRRRRSRPSCAPTAGPSR